MHALWSEGKHESHKLTQEKGRETVRSVTELNLLLYSVTPIRIVKEFLE